MGGRAAPVGLDHPAVANLTVTRSAARPSSIFPKVTAIREGHGHGKET